VGGGFINCLFPLFNSVIVLFKVLQEISYFHNVITIVQKYFYINILLRSGQNAVSLKSSSLRRSSSAICHLLHEGCHLLR